MYIQLTVGIQHHIVFSIGQRKFHVQSFRKMWRSVFGWALPEVSKVQSDFIFRVKHSRRTEDKDYISEHLTS